MHIHILVFIIGIGIAGGVGYLVNETIHSQKGTGFAQQETANTELVIKEVDKDEVTNSNNVEEKNTKDSSLVKYLQEQVKNLTNKSAQVETQVENKKEQNKIITLPSGAIVEIDKSGQVIQTIQDAPMQTSGSQTSTQDQVEEKPTILNFGLNLISLSSIRIEWETDVPTESKVFISGDVLSSQVFESESGLSTKHFIELTNFDISKDVNYSYEIEAINSKDNSFYKKNGSFTLLSRPYSEILISIKVLSDLNSNLSCSELFLSQDDYIVCLYYRES